MTVYSPLCKGTIISPNRNSPRNHVIDTITIHCTAGEMSADGIKSWFGRTASGVSCNYAIALDGAIIGVVPEGDRSWCTSSRDNDNRAITIEVSTEANPPYKGSEKAYSALLLLLADICQRNGIERLLWKNDAQKKTSPGYQNMTVHRWFSSTACPGDWLMERMGTIADAVNADLSKGAAAGLYRVQVGAYKSRQNAETMLSKLKALGIDGFITYG